MRLASRDRGAVTQPGAASEARPVMLVTFDVPVRADAAALAVDSAVESGQQLVLVNLVELDDPADDGVVGRRGRRARGRR